MKKVFAVLIVMVMVCVAVSAGAMTRKEYYQEVRDDTVEILEQLVAVYDDTPEYFEKDWIYLTFAYVKAAYSMTFMESAEGYFEVDDAGDVTGAPKATTDTALGMNIMMAQTLTVVEDLINETFNQWTDGEMTNEEASEKIIKLARSIINTYGAPEE